MNKALEIHLGLDIPIKLNERLIDYCAVFFRLPGSSEAVFFLKKLLLVGDQWRTINNRRHSGAIFSILA